MIHARGKISRQAPLAHGVLRRCPNVMIAGKSDMITFTVLRIDAEAPRDLRAGSGSDNKRVPVHRDSWWRVGKLQWCAIG